MALASVAVPPLTLKAKSLASRAPGFSILLYTLSLKYTVKLALSFDVWTESIFGAMLAFATHAFPNFVETFQSVPADHRSPPYSYAPISGAAPSYESVMPFMTVPASIKTEFGLGLKSRLSMFTSNVSTSRPVW